jgi:hypothetical protein
MRKKKELGQMLNEHQNTEQWWQQWQQWQPKHTHPA